MNLQLEGLEDLETMLQSMSLENADLKKAAKTGIKTIANELEKASPNKTGRLAKIKTSVKDVGLGVEATAKAGTFYDVFQEFGTSKQKKHVGYFEGAFKSCSDKALQDVAEIVFKKIK